MMERNAGIGSRMADAVGTGVNAAVDHPLYNVAQAVPGLNIPLSVISFGSHVARGQTGAAVVDAASMVPGVGATYAVSRMVPKVMPSLTRGSVAANGMRAGTVAQGIQAFQTGFDGANKWWNDR